MAAAHYEALGVSRDADAADIGRRYRALVLELHPDRRRVREGAGEKERYRAVRDAYEVLGDAARRAEYDEALRRRDEADAAVWREVDLDDMDEDEEAGVFSLPCRCGARFEAPEERLAAGYDTFECPSCSLRVRVLFEEETDSDS